MPLLLERLQEEGHLHFITFSCAERLPYFAEPDAKETVEHLLEQTRKRHNASIYGYVVMPEHVHLIMNEPETIVVGQFIKALKQETSRKLRGDRRSFWMSRYYDFNVYSGGKMKEKMRYMHRNPVARGLVKGPEDYSWSSYLHYLGGLNGTVTIESGWLARL